MEEREPQFNDRVHLPRKHGEGKVVAMAQTVKGWTIAVRHDGDAPDAPLWKGFLAEVELLEPTAEDALEGSRRVQADPEGNG